MEATRVFLAWSHDVRASEALLKALEIVRRQLQERGYTVYDWSEQHHIRNIGSEIEDQLRKSDLVILESTAGRPNPAFEVGFARCLDLPIIILKQDTSDDLPVDFGAPKYLSYPSDADKEQQFKRFHEDLDKLLGALAEGALSLGHRELRRARSDFSHSVQQIIEYYAGDHAHVYLTDGWVRALAGDIRSGGPSTITADADYYIPMFSALQKCENFTTRAIADLTDNSEPFWKSGHSEPLSAPIGERIFLIDWRMFFEREQELARYIGYWRNELLRHEDYEIYVATQDNMRLPVRHPFGSASVGLHLLLIEPGDTFGGYRNRQDYQSQRQFCMEQDPRQYQNAKAFYDAVLESAIRLEPSHDVISLKRAWLTKHRIGYWSSDWTQETERRPADYFDFYDQHIRCWVPSYNELVTECAATVAREIMRIRQVGGKPVNLLEIGYGTGSLTAQIVPWINYLTRPFEELGDLPPVDYYHAIDRAEQMRMSARENLGAGATSWLRLLKKVAWREVRTDIDYDIIFGSLVMHFMTDRTVGNLSADTFFEECAKRLRDGGSLVFADSFGANSAADRESAAQRWCDWMVRNGLSQEYADSFLKGNPDMANTFSTEELKAAAGRHGFIWGGERSVSSVREFKIIVFRLGPAQRNEPTT